MRDIYILIDYRSQFYFSTRHRGASFNLNILSEHFLKAGLKPIVKEFREIDFQRDNFKGELIVYQSSEDPQLFYKDYIEDILLGLQAQGAILIPDFYKFRAHHNKVFMEILRDLNPLLSIKNIKSKSYGTYEDFYKEHQAWDNKIIVKPASGTRSRGVKLLESLREKIEYPKKISRSFTFDNFRRAITKFFTGNVYVKTSNNRKKFVVQSFIPGLNGDYRILIYNKKFYVLFRYVRPEDFRASGSGNFFFPSLLPPGLLDYAADIFKAFDNPFLSLDVGYKDGKFYLFEFQFLCLGQYALEKSHWYFMKNNEGWKQVWENPDLEREFANSIGEYIHRRGL
jgi:glutathione synthase/RimK-type ligase-like ATP-grasp enzyme